VDIYRVIAGKASQYEINVCHFDNATRRQGYNIPLESLKCDPFRWLLIKRVKLTVYAPCTFKRLTRFACKIGKASQAFIQSESITCKASHFINSTEMPIRQTESN
jgi:hypothetical protein